MIDAGARGGVPFAWVAADSIYGVGEIEMALRRAYKGYVLGVTGQHQFWSWERQARVSGTAEEIAQALDRSAWHAALGRRRAPRDRACTTGPTASSPTLEAEAVDGSGRGLWTRGLLIRRSLADGSLAYFTTWCPAGTPIETLVAIEGRRWAIEDAFETAKTELGLAHNETRSWHGWHRHVSLVMLAFAMLARVAAGPTRPPPKTRHDAQLALVRWSVQEIRRVAMRLAQRRIEPAFVIAWSAWRRRPPSHSPRGTSQTNRNCNANAGDQGVHHAEPFAGGDRPRQPVSPLGPAGKSIDRNKNRRDCRRS